MKKRILIELGFAFTLILFSASFLAAAEYWGETGAEVYIEQGIFCPGNHTKWVDTFTGNSYPTINADPVFDCRDFQEINGNFSGENSCCPMIGSTFTTCQLVSSSEFSVELLPIVTGIDDRYTCLISDIRSCSNYTTESECEDSSTTAIAEYDIESNDIYGAGWCNKPIDTPFKMGTATCSNFTSCGCVWNGTRCLANATKYRECNNGSRQTYQSCQYSITIDDSQCSEPNGMITKIWDAVSGGPSCVDGSEQGSCVDITRLGFFTWVNTIAVIVILVAVYCLIARKKRKKKG